MTEAQLVAAALRELRATTPDKAQAAAYLSEIPANDVVGVLAALTQMTGVMEYRATSVRVKAGAR